MVFALVMAGGKGTRMSDDIEKPLVLLNSKPMIDYVLNNLKSSQLIEKIFIATSPNHPLTEKHVLNKDFSIIKTPGKSYTEDLNKILSKLESEYPNEILLTIAADLPAVNSKLIDEIINEYFLISKNTSNESLCVTVPVEIFENYNLAPSFIMDSNVPAGINILMCKNKIQNEKELNIPKLELALNINTNHDIKVFEKFFGDL